MVSDTVPVATENGDCTPVEQSPSENTVAQNGDAGDMADTKTNGHGENGIENSEEGGSSKGESEGSNSDGSDDENRPKGRPLFEAPEKIPDGVKRDRKSISRLEQDKLIMKCEVLKKNQTKWQEPAGTGSPLINMKKVKDAVMAMEKDDKHDDIKTLYKFCYNATVARAHARKRLLRFKGLDYTKESQPQKAEKHEEMLGLFPMASLTWAMRLFGVPKPPSTTKTVEVVDKETGEKTEKVKSVGPDKDDLIDACMEWLYHPKAVKDKPKPKSKKSLSPKKKPAQKRKSTAPIEGNDKPTTPKKPKSDKPKKLKNPDSAKKSAKKPKKEKSKKPAGTNIAAGDGASVSSDEDQPLKPSKKEEKAPGKKELRRAVNKILKKANLEEVTMKVVCNQIYDMYPDFRDEVMAKKGDIKTMVKEFIASS